MTTGGGRVGYDCMTLCRSRESDDSGRGAHHIVPSSSHKDQSSHFPSSSFHPHSPTQKRERFCFVVVVFNDTMTRFSCTTVTELATARRHDGHDHDVLQHIKELGVVQTELC